MLYAIATGELKNNFKNVKCANTQLAGSHCHTVRQPCISYHANCQYYMSVNLL